MKKIISVAGTVGSGKSTICNALAEKLGYKCYVMGDIMRKLAKEHNMDIEEFNQYIKDKKEIDNLVDNKMIEIANKEDNLVISSRTAWHFIPDSFKVYLTICDEEAAKRIFYDKERMCEKKYLDIEEAIEGVNHRNKMEAQRYMNVYNIDVNDKNNYDVYLDTTNMSIDEVLDMVVSEYETWLKGKI